MIVVADSSPLHYLLLIGHVETLPSLFERIVIPNSVALELQQPQTPGLVRHWMGAPPAWANVVAAREIRTDIALGRGEVEAMQLAADLRAEFLLMDDRRARRAAKGLGLNVIGTLTVIGMAAQKGLLDFSGAIERLRGTNFHVSEATLRQITNNAFKKPT